MRPDYCPPPVLVMQLSQARQMRLRPQPRAAVSLLQLPRLAVDDRH
jgi:hypothetical protein